MGATKARTMPIPWTAEHWGRVAEVRTALKRRHGVRVVAITEELAEKLTPRVVRELRGGLPIQGDWYGGARRLEIPVAENRPPLKVCAEIVGETLYVGIDGITGAPDGGEDEGHEF